MDGSSYVVNLKVVGWGPFRLFGERKRLKQAEEQAQQFMAMLEEIESRNENEDQAMENWQVYFWFHYRAW